MAVNAAPPAPAVAEKVVPEGFKALAEGKATILQRANDVFYNPAQVVNRDLSIAVLKYFVSLCEKERAAATSKSGNWRSRETAAARDAAGGIHILEGLAASGLRAIRYAKEIGGVARVTANDLDPNVVEALTRNVAFNDAEKIVVPSTGDARLVMMQGGGSYDAVDLDPYGSPSILLDSAMQSVRDGGLLLVTATDMAVLCGNNSEACFAKYGCYPLHKPYCHEQAIRILLGAMEVAAAKHRRHIEPLVSLSIDFYVRVFVRVHVSAKEVKNSATRMGYVWQSLGCDSFEWQRVGRKIVRGNSTKYSAAVGPTVPPKCPDTGANWAMGGPFWAEPLHNQDALRGILSILNAQKADFPAHARVHALLTAASEELPDAPLYFNLHDVCKTLHCTPPRAEILRSAIVNAGYRVSSTHACALGIKTDAPFSVIWDIMRCWIADHPIKNPDPESNAGKLLSKAPQIKANFARALGASSKARAAKVARFLPNPSANWGPKAKHSRSAAADEGKEDGAGANGEAAEQAGAANGGTGEIEGNADPSHDETEGLAGSDPVCHVSGGAEVPDEPSPETATDGVTTGAPPGQ